MPTRKVKTVRRTRRSRARSSATVKVKTVKVKVKKVKGKQAARRTVAAGARAKVRRRVVPAQPQVERSRIAEIGQNVPLTEGPGLGALGTGRTTTTP
jgi:hypothetical protein